MKPIVKCISARAAVIACAALVILAAAASPAAHAMGIATLTFSESALQRTYPNGLSVAAYTLNAGGTADAGDGRAQGRAGQLKITATSDKGTPLLSQMAANGAHILMMKLAAGAQTLTFKDVTIAHIEQQSAGHESPMESVTFTFRALEDSFATPAPIDRAKMPVPLARPPILAVPTKSP